MQTITLTCKFCSKPFEKPLKEYTRRTKQGFNDFFCSRTCTGHHVVGNLPDGSTEENIAKMRKWQTYATRMASIANRKYSNEDLPFNEHLRRTKKRGKDVDVDIPYLKEVWARQEGRCAITGIPLLNIGETRDYNRLASLDRIDSSKGYVRGNVQFVVCAINWAKGPRSDDDVRTLINLILENR